MTLIVLVVLIAAVLGGCGPTQWSKADPSALTAEKAQFRKDSYECERDAALSPHANKIGPDLRNYSYWLFDRCMEAKGYKKD